jgi:translation initiation factor 2B subunit (eIF-2B alpha/beta/delta family)
MRCAYCWYSVIYELQLLCEKAQHEETVSKYQGQLRQARKLIEELEADKSMAVAATKQELHATLEAKDEELIKIRERVKSIEAETEALKQKTHELQAAGVLKVYSLSCLLGFS